MNLIPGSTLTSLERGTPAKALLRHFSLGLWKHELLAECDGQGNLQVLSEMAGQHYSCEKRWCIPFLAVACPRLGPLGKSVWLFPKSQCSIQKL